MQDKSLLVDLGNISPQTPALSASSDSGSVTVQDAFDFLSAYFAGC